MNDMSLHLTIPTRTQAMLRDVLETSLAIGRLSIARGRAGIGKSFAPAMTASCRAAGGRSGRHSRRC